MLKQALQLHPRISREREHDERGLPTRAMHSSKIRPDFDTARAECVAPCCGSARRYALWRRTSIFLGLAFTDVACLRLLHSHSSPR